MMVLDKEEYVEHVERKYWIRQWVARRQERGAYNTIFRELALEDSSGFADYMRMPHCKFIELLRANAQKNRANRGHCSKPNLPSF